MTGDSDPKDVRRLRRVLDEGDLEAAIRVGWRIARRAVPGGDARALTLLAPLAAEIERRASGRSKADAESLAVYASRCLDDLQAGVPRNPTISLLFRRLGDVQVKSCPDCAENVRSEARVCRYCGHRFEPPVSASR